MILTNTVQDTPCDAPVKNMIQVNVNLDACYSDFSRTIEFLDGFTEVQAWRRLLDRAAYVLKGPSPARERACCD